MQHHCTNHEAIFTSYHPEITRSLSWQLNHSYSGVGLVRLVTNYYTFIGYDIVFYQNIRDQRLDYYLSLFPLKTKSRPEQIESFAIIAISILSHRSAKNNECEKSVLKNQEKIQELLQLTCVNLTVCHIELLIPRLQSGSFIA